MIGAVGGFRLAIAGAVAALRLLGRPLDATSNQAALDYLASVEGNTWERVDRTVALVCGLPEAQLR